MVSSPSRANLISYENDLLFIISSILIFSVKQRDLKYSMIIHIIFYVINSDTFYLMCMFQEIEKEIAKFELEHEKSRTSFS